MNEKEIKNLIKEGESEKTEFKESLSLKDEIGKTVSAFSNSNNGIIVVGVNDFGKIIGVQTGKKTIEELANYIKQNTDNHIYPKITIENINDKAIIAIHVNEANEKPVFFKGYAFKRIGKSNHKLSASEIRKLAKESGQKVYWDKQVCETANLKDIDEQAVKWFRREYKKKLGKKLISSNKELLKSLGCIKEPGSKITNTAILLFGKNPKKFFPRYYTSIVRYPGNNIGTAYLEIKDIEGNLFEIIDKAEKYIRGYMETFHLLKEGHVAREAVLQYPAFVIRELVVNAVAHRDYSITGSRIIIKMFKDRIEFDSPGGFGGNVNEKNILDEQFSRNPTIVNVLNKINYIEELGEGWDRIIDTIKNYPLKFSKMPNIKGNSRVIVTLYSPKEKLMENAPVSAPVSAPVKLSHLQQGIIDKIKSNKKITYDELALLLQKNRTTIMRNISQLKKLNKIKRIGSAKGGYWKIIRGGEK